MESAKFDFEVDKVYVKLFKEVDHKVIYHESILCDVSNFLFSSETETESVVIVDERVAEVVVFVAEFEGRGFELSTFFYAEFLRKAACCNVSYYNLKRNYLNFFNDSFTVAYLLNQVSWNACFSRRPNI